MIYKEKDRPEVGFQDIDKYDFGGLEVDEMLTNGYHLYIPYGIHCDLFRAIGDGVRALQNQLTRCEKIIKNLEKDIMEYTEEEHKNAARHVIEIQQDEIERINKDLKILEKIEPLINEI
jgi:hypothetical protein